MSTVRRCGFCFFLLDPTTKPCDSFKDYDTPARSLVKGFGLSKVSCTVTQLEDSVRRSCGNCLRIRDTVYKCIPEAKNGSAGSFEWVQIDWRDDDDEGRILIWNPESDPLQTAFTAFEIFAERQSKPDRLPISSSPEWSDSNETSEGDTSEGNTSDDGQVSDKDDLQYDSSEADHCDEDEIDEEDETNVQDRVSEKDEGSKENEGSGDDKGGEEDQVSSEEDHVSSEDQIGNKGENRRPNEVSEEDSAEGHESVSIYSAPDHPLGHPFAVFGTVCSGDTSSIATLRTIKAWMHQCSRSHRLCPRIKRRRMPTRLLEISKIADDTAVKLVHTKGRRGRYACLSHCWGGVLPKCMTKIATLNSNMAKIAWSDIPTTLQDAINVTYNLGIRYIWIDSLCIIQDDKADWYAEAGEMANIYENAVLTVAATHSSSDNAGLYSPGESEYASVEMSDDGLGNTLYFRRIRGHPLSWDVKASSPGGWPLLRRAWVYQERLLSARVVHFTSSEIIWECMDRFQCECGTTNTSTGENPFYETDPPKVRHAELINTGSYRSSLGTRRDGTFRWHEIAREYSHLGLSFEEDRLPAISGIAKQLARVNGPQLGPYLAGTWLNTLSQDLLWLSERRPGRSEYYAPTWSWVSANGPVEFPLTILDWTRSSFELLDYECVSLGPDKYLELKSARIVLSCQLVCTTLRYDRDSSEWMKYSVDLPSETDRKTQLFPDYEFSNPGKGYIASGDTVYCMRINGYEERGRGWCILLRRVLSSANVRSFERIGIVLAPHSLIEKGWFNENPERTIIEII